MANGKCQDKTSDTKCSSTAECIASDGKNYECEMENGGGFCYYSECKKDGECQTGYICDVKTDTDDGVLYAYGICNELDNPSTAVRFDVFKIMVVIFVLVMTLYYL